MCGRVHLLTSWPASRREERLEPHNLLGGCVLMTKRLPTKPHFSKFSSPLSSPKLVFKSLKCGPLRDVCLYVCMCVCECVCCWGSNPGPPTCSITKPCPQPPGTLKILTNVTKMFREREWFRVLGPFYAPDRFLHILLNKTRCHYLLFWSYLSSFQALILNLLDNLPTTQYASQHWIVNTDSLFLNEHS